MAGKCRGAIISNYCARFGKQHLEWSLFNRLVKEVSLVLNGVILAVILFVEVIISRRQNGHYNCYHRISFGNIIASLIGICTLVIDKFGIDPALATGPFITTSNDICGILSILYSKNYFRLLTADL
jgi:magnesium transporter